MGFVAFAVVGRLGCLGKGSVADNIQEVRRLLVDIQLVAGKDILWHFALALVVVLGLAYCLIDLVYFDYLNQSL